MSLKIKKATGEIFDLPPDYVIESEKNNPLFTNKGSQSVSIAFPNTDNNRKLLEHANRLDIAIKPSKSIPVVVESGPVHQSGIMIINSASDQTISANIGWDESEMYASMGTTQLRDLRNLPVFTAGGDDLDTRVDAMLTHLTAVMKEQIDADYYIFPIILKHDIEEKESEETSGKFTTDHYEILNDFQYFKSGANGDMGDLMGLTSRIIPRWIDSEVILFDVPKGYGVSSFLKVGRLLELIFEEHFGWKLANNPFKEHRQLKRLVVLNNTMDTVLTGRLHYKDMMPDITIKEFIDSLYNKFGMQYFVNSNTKTIELMFWKDVLSAQSTVDFTKYKTAPVTINYSQNKQLKLVANREIEGTEVPYNTFEEFLSEYDSQFKDYYRYEPLDSRHSSVFHYRRYYWIRNLDSQKMAGSKVSTDFFDWDKKSDLPYEEIKMTDLCLPLDRLYNDEVALLLFYSIGYKHAYSDISVSGESFEEKQNKAKLAFAFGWGKTGITNDTDASTYFFASQDNRDENGRFIFDENGERYDLSLTCHREDGLFNRFWKEYDAFLRHSAYGVDVKLKLSETEILRLKMFRAVSIDNQPLLPEQIKLKQNKSDAISECKFKTIRLYQPYDLKTEQSIVAYHPQIYYWRIEHDYQPDIEAWLFSQSIPYSIEDFPGTDGSNRQPLLWLPPTETEFNNQQTRTSVYNYVVIYSGNRVPVTKTTTYYPTLIS